MANTSKNKSNSDMSKLKSLMRFQFDLDNPEIHSCYWKSTSESGLTHQYGTRRNRDELVVRRATRYKRGITVPEVLGGRTLEHSNQQTITAGS